MTKQNKILIGVLATVVVGVILLYTFTGKKAGKKRSSFEEFEKRAKDAKIPFTQGLHHVGRETLIENWQNNLTESDTNRAIEIIKTWKEASQEERQKLYAEGKALMDKLKYGA